MHLTHPWVYCRIINSSDTACLNISLGSSKHSVPTVGWDPSLHASEWRGYCKAEVHTAEICLSLTGGWQNCSDPPAFTCFQIKWIRWAFFLHSFQKVISIKQPWIPFVDSAPELYGTFSLKFILIMSSYSSYRSVRFIIFNHILSSYNSCVAVCELCYSAFFSLSSGCCQVRHNKVGYFCPILQPQILHWHLNIIPSDTVRQK